jgi:UDP-glucose 4-epimerase
MNTQPWLVTGAAGFLGSHIVDGLLARGIPVLALDDFSGGNPAFLTTHHSHPAFTLIRLDIRDLPALQQLLLQQHPAVVIHLAALHFIPACVADPMRTISLNVLGTQSLLLAALAAQVERFFFASTGDVYAPADQPHHEDHSPTAPFNIYGLSKLWGEQLVALAARQRPAMRCVVGRLFNLYGPRETNPHILPEILKQLRAAPQAPLRLGQLWPKRDLVPVADAARAIIELIERAKPGVTTVNIATGVAVSMRQVLDLIAELLGRPLQVETDPAKVRPVERPHLQADVTRLRQLLGWTPHANLRLGLHELLQAEQLL